MRMSKQKAGTIRVHGYKRSWHPITYMMAGAVIGSVITHTVIQLVMKYL